MSEQNKMRNPRKEETQPPMPKQKQTPPGYETKMQPKPDHGEQSYHGHGRLKGKAAIITGSDSGIGKAVALAFAREGADVLISYWNEHKDANDTKRLVEEAGQKAILHAGDISDEQVCQDIVEQAMAVFGHIDILVNNAAFQQTYKDLNEITPDVLEHIFGTNVFAMFYLAKHAVPHMQPGSAIINTASIEAYQPDPTLLPYASTKGAIVTFTKGLSEMLIKKGIRVNAVAPGPIWTPLIPASFPAEEVSKFGESNPTGRPGQPAELAPIYVLLSSDEASYMNGGVYDVTGGKWTA